MDTKVKSSVDPRSNQPGVDRKAVGGEKAPVFHVQTDVRAGGFYDWWFSLTEDANQADRRNQGV